MLDLGTGSGAVALALADERPDLDIAASDVSEQALALARANGQRLGLTVRWLAADLLTGVEDEFDALLSNPPYVAEGDRAALAPEIIRHEPAQALFAGADGLVTIRGAARTGGRARANRAHRAGGRRRAGRRGHGADARCRLPDRLERARSRGNRARGGRPARARRAGSVSACGLGGADAARLEACLSRGGVALLPSRHGLWDRLRRGERARRAARCMSSRAARPIARRRSCSSRWPRRSRRCPSWRRASAQPCARCCRARSRCCCPIAGVVSRSPAARIPTRWACACLG